MTTKLTKWQDAAKQIGLGKSARIVICRTRGCSSCDLAESQLFSTQAWKAKGIPLVNVSGLPAGVQGFYSTPAIADVEIFQGWNGLRMRLVAGTKVVSFMKVNGQYTLAQFRATITTK